MNDVVVNHLDGEFGLINKVRNAMKEAADQFVYIGFLLREAEDLRYYEEAGYSNIYDFCEDKFGFGRSSTNNFIRVYRQFGSTHGIGLLDSYKPYNYSQLTEMCSMNMKQLNECNPHMTVRQLRAVKKGDSAKPEISVKFADEIEDEPDEVVEPAPSRQSGQNDDIQTLPIFVQFKKETLIDFCKILNVSISDDWINGNCTGLGVLNDTFVLKLSQGLEHLKSVVFLKPDLEISDMGKCSNCGTLCGLDDNYCSDCGCRIAKT